MPERIPLRIDHYRYTDKGVTLEGELPQSELTRLSDVVTDNSGVIKYRLEFGIDVLHNRFMLGQIRTQVVLQCQRCLQDYRLDIDSSVAFAFVHTDFEAQRAEENALEPLFLEQKEYIDPRLLIEDELLLALPQIPVHSIENEICQMALNYPPEQQYKNTEISNKEQLESENPFAVLKKLQR